MICICTLTFQKNCSLSHGFKINSTPFVNIIINNNAISIAIIIIILIIMSTITITILSLTPAPPPPNPPW